MHAPSIIIYVQELLVVQNDMSAPPILILVVQLHHRHHQDRRPWKRVQDGQKNRSGSLNFVHIENGKKITK